MGFFNRFFGQKENPIRDYADFWEWFSENQSTFHSVVKTKDTAEIERKFFRRLGPKLDELKDGIFYLVGMLDDSTVDLVLTADANPVNIVFVEELVSAAPSIPGWQFTPLKQPMDIEKFVLTMNENSFDRESLSFYSTDHQDMPDLVEITLVHKAFEGEKIDGAKNGALIFLDNYLGELNFLTNIDEVNYRGSSNVDKECIPIEALSNYLETRRSLFVEKYEGVRIFTENDNYSLMEAELEGGRVMIATINTDLMKWDKKASHPWMLVVTLGYNGEATNGLPANQETADRLNEIEHEISAELKDADGYLNIGRQSANNERHIFFACIEFRKPSKVLYELQKRYKGQAFAYQIYSDKYWQSVSHFKESGVLGSGS